MGGKGFFYLKAALDTLWIDRQDFCLDVHFTLPKVPPYMKIHERYDYSDLEHIFDETDVLVVPSVWYETFGYTVLEALSYGVPVIITNTVGAKDILVEGAGLIVNNAKKTDLYEALKALDSNKLKMMNNTILEKQRINTLKDMSKEIDEKCYGFKPID